MSVITLRHSHGCWHYCSLVKLLDLKLNFAVDYRQVPRQVWSGQTYGSDVRRGQVDQQTITKVNGNEAVMDSESPLKQRLRGCLLALHVLGQSLWHAEDTK